MQRVADPPIDPLERTERTLQQYEERWRCLIDSLHPQQRDVLRRYQEWAVGKRDPRCFLNLSPLTMLTTAHEWHRSGLQGLGHRTGRSA